MFTIDNETKKLKAREQYVVKANELIQKTIYSLTLQEQKIILFAISKIKPHDAVDTWYETSVQEICLVCGMRTDDGFYYDAIKSDIEFLTRKRFVTFPDGHDKTMSWLGYADMNPRDGKIRFQFNIFMQPYLFELKERYTQYQLQNVLIFKSVHSIRLYELMKSYYDERKLMRERVVVKIVPLDGLKAAMGVETNYELWADFERYVLRKAVKEINDCAEDMEIYYKGKKEGRKTVAVEFEIRRRSLQGIANARVEKSKRLK